MHHTRMCPFVPSVRGVPVVSFFRLALIAIAVALWGTCAKPARGADETAAEAIRRHERVAERRNAVHVICHRGSSEFAHENTLEAYKASFELGADGNEIDIRSTKDGVLVCFHDDMLDHLLEAYGDVGDYAWEKLQQFRFREPGQPSWECRIPTLLEVLELHRHFGGLIHLDIKRPNLDRAIAEMLDRLDMWDHVAYCNTETGGSLLKDPRMKLCRYKGGLYLDRGEVFPDAIAAMLEKPGEGVIVDDPRGVVIALGRKGVESDYRARIVLPNPRRTAALPSEAELIAILKNAEDWNRVAETADERRESGERIVARAKAADELLARTFSSPAAFAALDERIRRRSLHKDWQFHGLDGAIALRSLILLHAPNAVETARFALWRDDPALEPVVNPMYKNPRSWTDFRVKMLIFPALAKHRTNATEQLCRDYLALTDDEANRLGPSQFEQAAQCLLSVSPKTETALELLKHRLQVVRGRTILHCLAHHNEAWSHSALTTGAKHALAYVPK